MKWGEKPWQTWATHGVIGVALMALFTLMLPASQAFGLAVWGYVFRELDQLRGNYLKGKPVPWLDHVMDIVSPAVTCGALWWWVT